MRAARKGCTREKSRVSELVKTTTKVSGGGQPPREHINTSSVYPFFFRGSKNYPNAILLLHALLCPIYITYILYYNAYTIGICYIIRIYRCLARVNQSELHTTYYKGSTRRRGDGGLHNIYIYIIRLPRARACV